MLVLLHGWGMHPGVWSEVAGDLAPRHDVRAPDLPGHGDSVGAPASFDAAVDELAARLPEAAAICGWSLGGLFALRLARRFPERVRALALVGATPCFVAREGWDWGMGASDFESFAHGMREDGRATLRRFAALCAAGGAASREALRALQGVLADARPPHPHALGWLRETDLRDEVARIAVPALVIHGARDRVAPAGAARWLARAIPRAKLAELADAAHVPFLSHRERFVREVESFVG